MTRFDIVVANRNRSEVFWEGFSNIENFDVHLDRIVFMDCSDDSLKELSKCLLFLDQCGLRDCNFVFIRRRNWAMNQGTLIDYTRLIGEGVLDPPRYAFFMQDHYVNKALYVKGDTIPDHLRIDLDHIYGLLAANNKLVVFAARFGFRLCASVPEEYCGKDYASYDDFANPPWCWVDGALGSIIDGKYCCDHFIYCDAGHLPGSHDICIAIDGCNLCVDPRYFVSHYRQHVKMYTAGLGDYTDALVWETRISKILYDQGLGFHELNSKVCCCKTEELRRLQPDPDSSKLWCYFYNSPLFYWVLGRDIWHYDFKITDAYFRYAQHCVNYRNLADKDTTMVLLYDSRDSAENFKGSYPTASAEPLRDARVTPEEARSRFPELTMFVTKLKRVWRQVIASPLVARIKSLRGSVRWEVRRLAKRLPCRFRTSRKG